MSDLESKMDRRRIGARELIMTITLAINVGALVWGAATMYAGVVQLRESVDTLNRTSTSLLEDMAAIKIEYNARISVLEAQVRSQEAFLRRAR